MSKWRVAVSAKSMVPIACPTVGFCDLLGTPYAPVSKTLSVNVKESTGIREDAPENSVTLYIDIFGIKMRHSLCS